MIDTMATTPEEAERLLSAVHEASERSRQIREEANRMMADASEARRIAVQAALDADLPRGRIADAAGVNRNLLYRIVGKTAR